jgi:FkbM family methyltransferase
MTKDRLQVVKYYLDGKKNNTSFLELINFFFASSYGSKAAKKIKSIAQKDDFYEVYFQDFNKPLYFPASLDLKMLHQVVVETFYPDNWHYYTISETKVTADDIIADCGASEGIFTFVNLGKFKKAYLIEPLPKFVNALKKTFAGSENVEIINCALSNKPGESFISEDGICANLDSGSGIKTKVETLDGLFYDKDIKITYIKADLEGYDYATLLGAKNLIEKNAPKIAITTYHKPEHAEQIQNYLLSLNPNYKIKTKGIYQETGSPVMLHAWV